MSTATLEKPKTRSMVAQPQRDFIFMARRQELRLVKKKAQERKDWEGNIVETIRGEHVAFVDGVLRVPPSGQMRGEHGEILDAKEVLLFLMGDPENGRLPHDHFGDHFDGFWLHEEAAPAPTSEERDRITEMAMDFDIEGLERLIDQEEKGWAREDLLGSARLSLEKVRSKLEERGAELAMARAEGAASASEPKPSPSKDSGPQRAS